MNRLTEQQKQNFFGNFSTEEEIRDSLFGDDYTPVNLVEAIREEHGHNIANEVFAVLSALGMESVQWDYSNLGGHMARADSLMSGSNGLLRISIFPDQVLDLDFAEIDSTEDVVVTPLLKSMGYVDAHLPGFIRKPSPVFPRVGCKVTKKIDDLNIQIVAAREGERYMRSPSRQREIDVIKAAATQQLTPAQTKEFFGDFEVNESASKLVIIDGKRYPNLIEACRIVFDNDIAKEVDKVIDAMGLGKLAWSTIARGDYVTASACLYGVRSGFELKISSKGLGAVHHWNYDESDGIVTPLLKTMGYTSTPLPGFNYHDHKPPVKTGCKVRKEINGYNIEFTATKQTRLDW